MVVLVLDPRWPTMVPVEVCNQIRGPVSYTDEVPAAARVLTPGTGGPPWLVTTETSIATSANDAIATATQIIRVPSLDDPVYQAVSVMQAARTRGQWEQAMTHASLVPYLLEESAELAEAIEQGAGDEALKKELADVLLQVLFHAEIASERGAFEFGEVAQAFVEKLKLRAPYLFDGSTGVVDVETQDRLWAQGKAHEMRRGAVD